MYSHPQQPEAPRLRQFLFTDLVKETTSAPMHSFTVIANQTCKSRYFPFSDGSLENHRARLSSAKCLFKNALSPLRSSQLSSPFSPTFNLIFPKTHNKVTTYSSNTKTTHSQHYEQSFPTTRLPPAPLHKLHSDPRCLACNDTRCLACNDLKWAKVERNK